METTGLVKALVVSAGKHIDDITTITGRHFFLNKRNHLKDKH